MTSSDNIAEGNQGESLSPFDRGIIDFSQRLVGGELELFASFARTMVTLSTSLLPVHFAILRFLGANPGDRIQMAMAVASAFFLVLSMVVFALVMFPTKGSYVPSDLSSIKEFRDRALRLKFARTLFGLVIFLAALGLIITQDVLLLFQVQ